MLAFKLAQMEMASQLQDPEKQTCQARTRLSGYVPITRVQLVGVNGCGPYHML